MGYDTLWRRAGLVLAPMMLLACGEDATHGEPRAGRVTAANAAKVLPPGDVAVGKPGDFYLRNELATFIIQGPGREVGLGTYGGSLVDLALAGGQDHFGEVIPTLAVGRTIRVDSLRVVADGAKGAAIVEARGRDAVNPYYNVEAVAPDLLGYVPGGGGLLANDPDASLGLEVRILYSLPRDEARLGIRYVFTNVGDKLRRVPLALLVDARGALDSFYPGGGFQTALRLSSDPDDLTQMLATMEATTPQAVLLNHEMAMGILPRRVGDESPPRVIGSFVPEVGGGLLLEARSALGAGTDASMTLRPGASVEVDVDVLLAETPAEVLERGWELLDQELTAVSGCVTLDGGEPAAGVRVGLTHEELGAAAVYETDAAGCFAGRVPPGAYTAVAGAPYREPSPEQALTAPGSVRLTLPPLGAVALAVAVYTEVEAAVPAAVSPCRLTLFGQPPLLSHPTLGHRDDNPGGPVHRMFHLASCDEGVEVVPGRYLAAVSRGPEYDLLEQVIEVRAGQTTTVSGELRRAVDSAGYAASELHVHSIYSPDSAVPARDRVLSMAAGGVDFWAATEHDVVVDYTRHIRDLGLENELLTVPGAEVTSFDTGHWNVYPLDVRPGMANGGSPDWAGDGTDRPTMDVLFAHIHERGALVQANHPRGGGIGNYFTRGGLRWDPVTLQPFADPTAQPIGNEYLRYPPGVVFFSDQFDVIEIMNGTSTYVRDGMVHDRGAERAGHDFMNYLSSGRRMVATANSDTHTLAKPPGNPRTMIGGHDGGVEGIVAALRRGDAVVTNGPMIRASLLDASGQEAGLGDLLTPVSPEVTLRVQVETPDWYDVDALEVVANAFFPDPDTGEDAPRAVPLVALTPARVERGNGATAQVAVVELPLDLSQPPFDGHDSWLVVRAGGTGSVLYPVMFGGGGSLDLEAETPESFLHARSGQRPFAMTNPIYVDGDGDGRWH